MRGDTADLDPGAARRRQDHAGGELSRRQAIEPLWYRLDEGDADPATLFLYLRAVWPGRRSGRRLPMPPPDVRLALPLFTRRFFGGLFACPRTKVLVFDDYHEVAPGSPLHACLAQGLEEVPADRRVILVSRAPPPPEFARLRVNGLLRVIEPGDLRLTVAEAEGLARRRGADLAPAHVATMVQQTQGWVAGLILMAEANDEGTAAVPAVLFDYFAGEILQKMEPARQRLLCMLAVMPVMTAAAAVALARSTEAAALLDDLRRRNYFTTGDVAGLRYRFHPLFRDFLRAAARQRIAPDELDALRVKAAELLDADEETEAAVQLLGEARAFEALADVVRRRAPALIAEGRNATLTAWLARLPDDVIEADPWLCNWLGEAYLTLDGEKARGSLEKAFARFEREDDPAGQYLAWAALADQVRVDALGDHKRYDPLIASLRRLYARHPAAAPQDVMVRVGFAMTIALARRTGARDEWEVWRTRTLAAAKAIGQPDRYELCCFMVAITDLHDARYERAMAILESIPDPLTLGHRSVTTQVSGLIAHAMAHVYRYKADDGLAYVERALRTCDAIGYHGWSHLLAGLALHATCRKGDLAASTAWLGRMRGYAQRLAADNGSHYRALAAGYHLLNDDLAAARHHADTAVAIGVEAGWHFTEGMARIVRAEVLIDTGLLDEAEAEIAGLDGLFARSLTRTIAATAVFLRADTAFARGDDARGLALLRDAVTMGRRQGDRRVCISAARSRRLFGRALRAGIEPDYIRDLIRWTGIVAADPHDEDWSWPIKITSFGGFVVARDGVPLTFSRKTPKRLILLLKAIVALGGRDVPEEKLIDSVWPDHEGDAATSALRIAIHRLRKILGDPATIVVDAGRIGLDPSRCWLDTWSFEHLSDRRRPAETAASHDERIGRALRLYRGDFFAGDDDLWWAEPRRRLYRRSAQNVERARSDLPTPPIDGEAR